MTDAVILQTARLTLRRPAMADLAAFGEILTHPQAMRYWGTPPHETPEQTRKWMEDTVASSLTHASDEFSVELAGQVIGKAGAWRMPEIGYILHPDHWGLGYAFEAMTAVINHLFDTHKAEKLTADVDPRNFASLALLGKLGFQETSRARNTLQWGDEWCDSIYLALGRDCWTTRSD